MRSGCDCNNWKLTMPLAAEIFERQSFSKNNSFELRNFLIQILLYKRVQIAGCLLVSILIPAMTRSFFTDELIISFGLMNTYFSSVFAVLLGYFLYNRMVNQPGVESALYITPIFAGSFALVAVFFLMTLIEYSCSIFLVSAIVSILWFYWVDQLTRSKRRLRFAIVPGGTAPTLTELNSADWVLLESPKEPFGRVDGIVADLRSEPNEEWAQFITETALNSTPVYHVKGIKESLTGKVEFDHLSENVFGSLVPVMGYLKIKFFFEWLVAFLALILLLPLMLAIAAIIRLESSGSALFKQHRMGFRGKSFSIYKFRTMISESDLDPTAEGQKTQKGDRRITKFGQWLRTHRLDELPQLINVLRGEMSLIGPRPEASHLSKVYATELPYYRYRHIVRPGISGWAQVNQGHVAEVDDVNLKLHYDFYYIKNCSLWLDIVIALRTIKTMVFGTGAK